MSDLLTGLAYALAGGVPLAVPLLVAVKFFDDEFDRGSMFIIGALLGGMISLLSIIALSVTLDQNVVP